LSCAKVPRPRGQEVPSSIREKEAQPFMRQQLTLKIAQKFLQDEEGDLDAFTSIDAAAAQALAQHKGTLWLYGLTSLSDAAAQALAKHKGGNLSLGGLTSLSDAAAQALAKHEGILSLRGLTSLSDAAAQALAKHKGETFSSLA